MDKVFNSVGKTEQLVAPLEAVLSLKIFCFHTKNQHHDQFIFLA